MRFVIPHLNLHHRIHPVFRDDHSDVFHRHACRDMNILQLPERPRVNILPADTAQNKIDLWVTGQHIRDNHRPAGLYQPQRTLEKNHRIDIVEIVENPQRIHQFGLMLAQLMQ